MTFGIMVGFFFSKISKPDKPTERHDAYHLQFDFLGGYSQKTLVGAVCAVRLPKPSPYL